MTAVNDIGIPADVKISNLCKAFGSKQVLKGFDLTLPRGKNLVVIGRSGSGKSVLLKCIIGLVKADSGEISVLGKNIMHASRDEINQVRTEIGFLFQSNALYDSMNVQENLLFTLERRQKGLSPKEKNRLVHEVLENVGLPGLETVMPAELSGGMKKRIGLARALILKPRLILYDEPTTGLDPITGKEIGQLILDMQNIYNISSLIISHDIPCVRMVANRIITLIEGKAYASGTYQELAVHPDPMVHNFFK